MEEKQYLKVYISNFYITTDGVWQASVSIYPPSKNGGDDDFVVRIPVPEKYISEDLGIVKIED